MNRYFKATGYGLVVWGVPFIASFFFFDVSTQSFTINEIFFKSIMIVLSTLVGSSVLVMYFKDLKKDFIKEGLIVGLIIMGVNLLLDLVVLVPMSKMPLGEYYTQIGLRYWIAPIIGVALGKVKA